MASTNKCEFCGSTITSNDQSCPNCGATNPLFVVDNPGRVTDPKTIAELQEYCAERGMPLLRMRFFIGEDFKEPRAFGIYKAGPNEFVVYKNKADGTRAERYRGPDEAHAVIEIYDKLIEECHNRGIYPDQRPGADSNMIRYTGTSSPRNLRSKNSPTRAAVIAIVVFILFYLLRSFFHGIAGAVVGNVISNAIDDGYSSDYVSSSSSSWWDDDSSSSWSSSDSDSSWWSSDDDDSWWSSSDDDSWGSSDWDSDWGSDYSSWDSGSSSWDDDW